MGATVTPYNGSSTFGNNPNKVVTERLSGELLG